MHVEIHTVNVSHIPNSYGSVLLPLMEFQGALMRQTHGTQPMQRPFVSSPYFSTVMFTPLYLERDQPVGPNTPGTSTAWKFWGRWPCTKPEETKWGLWCAENHEFRPRREVLDLSRKCYSQLISIHRTQHGHCPLVWFYAQNPMYPPQGRRPFWSLSYKTEELQRIHPPCVGYLWAKVTHKKMECFFSKRPGIVPLERPLHRVVALVLHIGLGLVPFMGDALSSRVIPSCLDASEPSWRIQRIPNVDVTAPRKGAAKSSKMIVSNSKSL